MKKLIPLVALLLVLLLALAAPAGAAVAEKSVNVVLAGDNLDNTISIGVSSDGRWYTIESTSPLEVGGEICAHREGLENELQCEATAIAGFEVNGNGGADSITLAANVPAPATMRGGPGDDKLLGGSGADKLLGGLGDDTLGGRGGDDALYGGPGDDKLLGGSGDDRLFGEAGEDVLLGGSGVNEVVQ